MIGAALAAALAVRAFAAAGGAAAEANALRLIDAVARQGPYQTNWASLERHRAPDWRRDGKFGIRIDWGVYSVPGFGNEWYAADMYDPHSPAYRYHRGYYGAPAQFGYKDFIPMFRGQKFDPAAWTSLFKQAGARLIVMTAEHADGFPMYDCGFTEWSAAKLGPRRDALRDLAAAARAQGLHFGAASHRAEHWWCYHSGRAIASDVNDPRYAGLYGPAQPANTPPDAKFLEDWLVRSCEIVDKYQPDLVWFDAGVGQPAFEPYLKKFAAFYYNRGAEWNRAVTITFKGRAFPGRAATQDAAAAQFNQARPVFWQTDVSIDKKSWGYIQNSERQSAGSLIRELVDVVSKNGALLLNVAPRSDGTIPEAQQTILRQVGRWLKVNGEAIFGTRPWKRFGEGPARAESRPNSGETDSSGRGLEIRFTKKGDVLYAIALGWPADRVVRIRSLARPRGYAGPKVAAIRLLGSRRRPRWNEGREFLSIELPEKKPCDYAYALKIEFGDYGSD